ncbi:MAG: hypothetical protein HFJ38_02585 [Bacilli bacterium]|nr:hypothetical protein [Bacilli bacterium]
MKKFILCILVLLFLLSGCTTTEYTPTKKVEEFMAKYQNLDSEVLSQLDKIVASDKSLTDNQKKDYMALMKRQYQNLSYKITDEKIEDDSANVIVEIEVYDYISSVNKSEDYYNNHKEEFEEKEKYMDYKITEMQKVSDRKQYEIVFTLRKEDDGWVMDNISDTDREKLHGLSNK